jgi:hypothetical protein
MTGLETHGPQHGPHDRPNDREQGSGAGKSTEKPGHNTPGPFRT